MLGVEAYTLADHRPDLAARKDPINLVFAGGLGVVERARELVENVLGCGWDKPLGPQWFCEPHEHGPAHLQDFSRATMPIALRPRIHTRLYQVGGAPDHFGLAATAAPIHRERIGFVDPRRWLALHRPVDDIVSSFDAARDWAVRRFEASGLHIYEVEIGNTATMFQSNGRPVASDGRLAIVADARLSINFGREVLRW
jgi:hypothetical protein